MILMSGMTATLFLGGWLPPFDWPSLISDPWAVVWFIASKFALVLFMFISGFRATTPRYRYDQLMRLGLEGVSALYPHLCGSDRRNTAWFWAVAAIAL